MTDTKGIPIYLRIKPSFKISDKKVIEHIPNSNSIKLTVQNSQREVKFNQVLDGDTSQSELFTKLIEPKLNKVIANEHDCSFFTLGPSNSGKSFTMFGTDNDPGIITRVLLKVFKELGGDEICEASTLKGLPGFHNLIIDSIVDCKRKGTKAITLSMFELYNDSFKDLLTGKVVQKSNTELYTNKDSKITPNISQAFLKDFSSAMGIMNKALKARVVSETNSNSLSSRSHCFIYLNFISSIGGPSHNSSRFTLADLAGNERTNLAKTQGDSLKEGSSTNSSLSELGRVLELFKNNQYTKSAIRNSKLTRLLFTDYVNNSDVDVNILVNLDPAGDPSTILQTLRFIRPVKDIVAPRRTSIYSRSTSPLLTGTSYKVQYESYRSKFDQLTIDFEDLQSQLVSAEMRIRNEVSNQYELSISELSRKYEEAKFNDHDNFQESTDKKLEQLKVYYETKLQELKDGQASIIDSKIELEKRIMDLEEQNIDCKTELESSLLRFQEELKEARADTTNVDDELEALTETNRSYAAKIEELVNSNKQLARELKRSRSSKEEQLIISEDLQSVVDFLKSQIEEQKVDIGNISVDLHLANSKVKSLEEEKENLIKYHDKQKKKLKTYFDSQKIVIKDLTEANEQLSTKLNCSSIISNFSNNVLKENNVLKHQLNQKSPKKGKRQSEIFPISKSPAKSTARLSMKEDISKSKASSRLSLREETMIKSPTKKRYSLSPTKSLMDTINTAFITPDALYNSATGSPMKKKKKLLSPRKSFVFEDDLF